MGELHTLCYMCGKIASHVCRNCGRHVCEEHYNAKVGWCVSCVAGRKMIKPGGMR